MGGAERGHNPDGCGMGKKIGSEQEQLQMVTGLWGGMLGKDGLEGGIVVECGASPWRSLVFLLPLLLPGCEPCGRL